MSKAKFKPQCLFDAPPQVLQLAEMLADGMAATLRRSIREELPMAGIQELNDLARGVCLIAAEKCQAITVAIPAKSATK